MKNMRGEEQGNILLIPVVLLGVLFIAAAIFGVWAFGGRQDYKDNVAAKVADAVAKNTKSIQAKDAADYAEAAKNPLKTFVGPADYGSVTVQYPKTWSAYADTSSSGTPLDAYFHTDYVPSAADKQTYNLRVQVVARSYSTVMNAYTSRIKEGTVKAAPYTLPKVPNVAGTRLTGAVFSTNTAAPQGTIILVPLRSTTLEIWTESNDFLPDFDGIILQNMTFAP